MKILPLLILLAVLLTAGTPRAQAADGHVSLDFFYETLDPYGNWREVGDYGYCWQPQNVGPGWQPYSDGRWVYTDAGWTWYSEEPYGWAVYHYGRWANVASVGWVWVPGTQWGPGWVSWRSSSQYVGWAPLPPEARFLISIGFSSWVDDYYGIGPGSYRFVENRHFGSRRLGSVFIDRSRNYSIINQTTNITNIRYERDGVRNDGPRYDELSRMSSDPIPRYKLQRRQNYDGDARRHSPEQLRPRLDGDSLSVFTPPVDARRPSSGPGRVGEKVANARIDHGWERAGSADEIAALRSKMKGPAEAPKALPSRPRFERGIDHPSDDDAARRPAARDSGAKVKPSAPQARDTPPGPRPGADLKKQPPPSQLRKPGQSRPELKQPQSPEASKPERQRPEMRKVEPPKPQAQTPPAKRPEMKRPATPHRTRPDASPPSPEKDRQGKRDKKKSKRELP